MITCPDTTVDIKTWRQEHPRNYAIIYWEIKKKELIFSSFFMTF